MMKSDYIKVAAEIVAAFVSNNSILVSAVPGLIESVYAAVREAARKDEKREAVDDAPVPAISIRQSITPDYLICLDDGKHYKSLRHHLAVLGMTPEQYREKWGLPPDYPMVAVNFSARRSEMAKSSGFGQKRPKEVFLPREETARRKPGRPRKLRP